MSRYGESKSARRARAGANLEPLPYEAPTIGHNMGPPLFPVISWHIHTWRKAQKKAWKTPPMEVVRMRTRRARAMGLDYRTYTLILLDRGATPGALIFDLGGTLLETGNGGIGVDGRGRIKPRRNAIEKLKSLSGCKIFIVADEANAAMAIEQFAALLGEAVCEFRACPEGKRDDAISALVAAHKISPSTCVLVGESEPGSTAFGGFVPASEYFGR